MEKVKLQFLEIFPSVSELTKSSQVLNISISSSVSTFSGNIQKIIEDKSSIEFEAKDKKIQVALYKSNTYLGSCEYSLNNETRWLSISNGGFSSKQDGLLLNLTDCIRLRMKCSLGDSTQTKVQVQKKTTKGKKAKDLSDGSIHHNSAFFSKKERLAKPAISTLGSKSRKREPINPIGTKLKNNKTCEDGFDSNGGLLLADTPFDLFHKNNGSLHNLKNTKSSQSSQNNKHSVKPISTCHRNSNNNALKSPIITGKLSTNSVQTTIVNNRNNSYENVSRYPQAYISHQSVPTKLDEKFKSFEDSIIDKNYENNLKNDEMIQLKHSKKFLGRMINENSEEDNKETLDLDFNKELVEEDGSRSLFNSIREDFEIFYTSDYVKAISDDTIKLELQLVIDKLCELQEAYHDELLLGMNSYEKYKAIFNHYSEKYLAFHKKYLQLKHKEERAHLTNTVNTFISNHRLKHNSEIVGINKAEISIWNQLPVYSPFVKAKSAIKDSSDSLFKKRLVAVFNVVTKRNKEALSGVERKLCEREVNKHSRTRSMEEPEINYTMPTVAETRNEIKGEVKYSINRSNENSHNKLISSSDVSYKKKESKFNKADKYGKPSIKGKLYKQ